MGYVTLSVPTHIPRYSEQVSRDFLVGGKYVSLGQLDQTAQNPSSLPQEGLPESLILEGIVHPKLTEHLGTVRLCGVL
jgi:hypothetical protein